MGVLPRLDTNFAASWPVPRSRVIIGTRGYPACCPRPSRALRPPSKSLSPLVGRLARAFGASLLLLVLAGAGVAAAADIGHEDGTGVGIAITGSKPESKLWFNDGKWWASMWSTVPAGFYIYRLDTGTETWVRTAPPSTPERRPAPTRSGTGTSCTSPRNSGARTAATRDRARTRGPALPLQLQRGDRHLHPRRRVPGVDARRTSRARRLVIAKDSTGTLWATWTLEADEVNGSTRITPSAGTTRPGRPAGPALRRRPIRRTTTSRRSSRSPSAGNLGSACSGATRKTTRTTSPGSPTAARTTTGRSRRRCRQATGIAGPADDHMNLKTDSSGKVYAVVKTSNSGSQPLILLLDRATGGGWSDTRRRTRRQTATRGRSSSSTPPTSTLHVFMTGPLNGNGSGQEGGEIVEKTSPTVAHLVRDRRRDDR